KIAKLEAAKRVSFLKSKADSKASQLDTKQAAVTIWKYSMFSKKSLDMSIA
ncbi:4557_t:CDS:2, partial [Dentiscutata heterogama]